MTNRSMLLALMIGVAPWAARADEVGPEDAKKLKTELAGLYKEIGGHFENREFAQVIPKLKRTLAISRLLYPESQHPNGHPNIGINLNNLGVALRETGAYEEALSMSQQALAMAERLYPAQRFPSGHSNLAMAKLNVADAQRTMGAPEKALASYRAALAMMERLYPVSQYPNGHENLSTCLANVGVLLAEMGRHDESLQMYEKNLAMLKRLLPAEQFPDGHPAIANCLDSMAALHGMSGAYDKALDSARKALRIFEAVFPEKKFPNGRYELAASLRKISNLLYRSGSHQQALPYLERALAMVRKLFPAETYPRGHPEIVAILADYVLLLNDVKQSAKAGQVAQDALTMAEKLYPDQKFPDGHSDIGRALNNLGCVLLTAGRTAESLAIFERTLAMYRRLYPADRFPAGHFNLQVALSNVGRAHLAAGSFAHAAGFFDEALLMHQRQVDQFAATAPEADALAHARLQPPAFDQLLSTTRHTNDLDASVYRRLWPTRAAVTRILEQRLAAARAAAEQQGERLTQLQELRRRTEQVLQEIRLQPQERDKLLSELNSQTEKLERELARQIPLLSRLKERSRFGPEDLARLLPANAVLIDILHFTHFEFARQGDGALREKRTPSYVAFIIGKDARGIRVELGDADPIDRALSTWRQAIDKGEDRKEAKIVRKLLWDKIAARLPQQTRTVYVVPAGTMAGVPLAALPGTKPDTVLAEEFPGGIAVVPHGQYLAEALGFPRSSSTVGSLLLLGNVDYGKSDWPALPAVAHEVNALRQIAPTGTIHLSQIEATPVKTVAALRKVRFAHLATHGFYDQQALVREFERAMDGLQNWQFGGSSGIAAKNPLGFVGLVLANGEVVTGLSLLDHPLDNLELVTLSACETGLGAAGDEGAHSLIRAFHLAGCPNVVASLWKVNDAATAALMAKFYHELWVNKKPPIEALREAQLTVYRHPERIPALAGERGKPDFAKTVELKPELDASVKRKQGAPTRLWAAFVLSGVGK